MSGTGRYNFALGVVGTAKGIGASLSGLAAGLTVDHFGYDAAFVTSALVAFLALAVLCLAVPETCMHLARCSRENSPQRLPPSSPL